MPEWAEQAFDDVRGTMLIKQGDDTQQLQSLIDTLRADNVTIGSIEPKRESLEDLFMRAVDHIDNPGSIR